MEENRKYKVIISDRAKRMYITQNKYHKMFIEKWYLVLYQIKDDTVYVDYILDCRKDYSWLVHEP